MDHPLVELYKKEYMKSAIVMSEFLRSVKGLTPEEKRELLKWSGDDAFMTVLDTGEITEKILHPIVESR